MQARFETLDWIVLVIYFLGVIWLGLLFGRRSQSSEQFTSGGRSLPGWLCGLSIFATFLSSISYLALPGKSFADNWNAFVFSLAIPPAAMIAVRYFLPLYREAGEVSAYALLERRFGLWARMYASSFYLLFQIARVGVVMYLMALPMAVIFGWDIRVVIVITGFIVTGYAFVGGILAVIWADAIQAVVLMVGAVVALAVLLTGMPQGPSQVFEIAANDDKFSLGSWDLRLVGTQTVWLVLLYGLFENLKNFGIDQSYIQRYIAAKSERDATISLWLSAGLYIPVSAVFFFIGTGLYAWHQAYPEDDQAVRRVVAEQRLRTSTGVSPATAAQVATTGTPSSWQEEADNLKPNEIGDRVFPHFIAARLPAGVSGLLIAAIFAAAMSTVSTSLNSSATLIMSDFHQRLVSPDSSDAARLWVLRLATIAWGAMGTTLALALVHWSESALDIWWTLSGILGMGIISLFLLGIMSPQTGNAAAITAVLIGTCFLIWMVLSNAGLWPQDRLIPASPFHQNWSIVLGPIIVIIAGKTLARKRIK